MCTQGQYLCTPLPAPQESGNLGDQLGISLHAAISCMRLQFLDDAHEPAWNLGPQDRREIRRETTRKVIGAHV